MTAVASRVVHDRQLDHAEYLLAAYVVVVPFGSAVGLPTPVPLDDLSSLVGAAASAALVIRFIRHPRVRRLELVGPYLWLVLLAVTSLSWYWSIVPRETFDDLIVYGSLIGQAFVAALQGYSTRFRLLVLRALSASAAITGTIAIYQLATGTLGTSGTGQDRFALVGEDPNITAAALLLPLAASLILSQRGWSGERAAPVHLIAAALAVTAIVLTVSRGGLLGIAVVVVLAALRRRPVWVWVGLFVLALAAAPLLPAVERGSASTGRSSIWRIAIEACNERCWFGAGLGSFPEVHQQFALTNPELAASQLRFQAHNVFLGGLVEIGFIGGFILVAVFGIAVASTWTLEDRFGRAAFAGMCAVLVANLLVSNLPFKYLWLALLVSTIAATKPHEPLIDEGADR